MLFAFPDYGGIRRITPTARGGKDDSFQAACGYKVTTRRVMWAAHGTNNSTVCAPDMRTASRPKHHANTSKTAVGEEKSYRIASACDRFTLTCKLLRERCAFKLKHCLLYVHVVCGWAIPHRPLEVFLGRPAPIFSGARFCHFCFFYLPRMCPLWNSPETWNFSAAPSLLSFCAAALAGGAGRN